MKKMLSLKLSREALLFDSPLYILKGFMSMMTAYLIFSGHPVIGRDMISVLFGMMLTLEPVNRSGLKSASGQLKATILGGIVTASLVSFMGVNWFTVPLAVALTMYIALKINWRFVSPVAIFTAIYMTQYIQLNAMGEPSMILTLRLRILALVSGIAVALFYNYVFSLFFYKKMVKKRVLYAAESLEVMMESTEEPMVQKKKMIGLLTDIDTLQNQLLDMAKDRKEDPEVAQYIKCIDNLRDLSHYYLDHVMRSNTNSPLAEIDKSPKNLKAFLESVKNKI